MTTNDNTNPALETDQTIISSTGDDTLTGGLGNDTISGQAGDDVLHGDSGVAGSWYFETYDRDFLTADGQAFDIDTTGSTQTGAGYVSDFNEGGLTNAVRGTTGDADDFGVIYTSTLNITDGGTYRFTTSSDDGSTIQIFDSAGNPVSFDNETGGTLDYLNNDFAQASTTRFGDVDLISGETYTIQIRYWEDGGGDQLSATVTGPNVGDVAEDLLTSDLIGVPPGPESIHTGSSAAVEGDDSLDGGAGNDTIFGEGGNDTLLGGLDNDSLDGGAGDDSLVGGVGDDTLDGGTGDDTLVGGDGADLVDGGSGNDFLDGGIGTDSLSGGAGNDTIFGRGNNDTIFAGAGNDSVGGGIGNDFISGGDASATILNGDFSAGGANWTGGASGIETNREDVYLGNGSTNRVAEINVGANETSTLEQDFVVTEPGSATLSFDGVLRTSGELGLDGYEVEILDSSGTVVGSMTVIPTSQTTFETFTLDVVFPDADTYTLRFTEIGGTDGQGALLDNVAFINAADDDTLSGGIGDDSIYGNGGDDSLTGGNGTDSVFGGTGDDHIDGGFGTDVLDGGDGNDTVSYLDSFGNPTAESLNLDLEAGTALLNGTDNEIATNFENAISGDTTDTITGTAGENEISSGGGNDVIDGHAGNDTLLAGAGDDTLTGGAGDDALAGGAGSDVLTGGLGADSLVGDDGDEFTIIYDEDFSSGAAGWSNPTTETDAGFGDILGRFAGSDGTIATQRTFDIDVSANEVVIEFDALLIDSWNGEDFIITVNGEEVRLAHLEGDTFDPASQSFTDAGGATYTFDFTNTSTGALGGSVGTDDTIMGVVLTIENPPSSVTIGFGTNLNSTLDNESFAIDNFSVVAFEDSNDTLAGGAGDDVLTGGGGDDVFIYNAGDGNDTITDFNADNTGPIDDGDQTNNDFIDLNIYYDDIFELRADLNDDGLLNQSGGVGIGNVALGGTIDLSGVSSADLTFDNTNVACFTAGCMIKTKNGEVAVEGLCAGMLVHTMDSGLQPIRAVMSRSVSGATDFAPVVISKGALGNEEELVVSPAHRMLISDWRAEFLFGQDEVLASAKSLCNGDTIYRRPVQEVTYFHILLDQHEIIYAAGCPTESYHLTAESDILSDEVSAELRALFPELNACSSPCVRPSLRYFEVQALQALMA